MKRKIAPFFAAALASVMLASCMNQPTGPGPGTTEPVITSETAVPTETDTVTETETPSLPETDETEPVTPEHVHTAAPELLSDEAGHYTICAGCGETIGSSQHEFGEWIAVSEATEDAEGLNERVCSVCGYRETEKTEKLSHTHVWGETWKQNKTYHWHVCEGCGDAGAKEKHSFGEWSTAREATEDEEGIKERFCDVCEYRETGKIEKLPHTHIWSDTLGSNETHHWQTCAKCGATNSKASHTYGEWYVAQEATTSSEGVKERRCTSCGRKQTEAIPMVRIEADMPANIAKVIIISGQSNAVGYSYRNCFNLKSDYYSQFHLESRLAKADAGYPDILIRYSNNPLDANQGTCGNTAFEPVKIGMGSKIPDPNYYKSEWGEPLGPEVGIAEYLSEKYPGEKFYIIKCATSGANLSWRWNPGRTGDLYEQMVDFVGNALSDLKSQGLKPEIITFCWMQGESDCQENYANYIGMFETLLNKFASDLAEYMPPNGMTVADAGIRPFWGWPKWATMNSQKKAFADKSSKRYFVDTTDFRSDIDRDGECGHFDCYPMIQLGNAFGKCVDDALYYYGNPEVLK